jgi:curved DNA-binding protein CbpA
MTLQQVIAAYAILGDPGRRAGYDHRTIAHQTSTAPRIRPVLRFPQTAADQPPIQAGPVHWDPNPR